MTFIQLFKHFIIMRETKPSQHSIILYDKLRKAYTWVCWAHETEPKRGAGPAVVWEVRDVCPRWWHVHLSSVGPSVALDVSWWPVTSADIWTDGSCALNTAEDSPSHLNVCCALWATAERIGGSYSSDAPNSIRKFVIYRVRSDAWAEVIQVVFSKINSRLWVSADRPN